MEQLNASFAEGGVTSWAHNHLRVVGLPGDYNQNGVVDAADYVLWRNNLGSGTALPNDDTAGVGPDDYTRWRANFGASLGAGSGAAVPGSADVAIPEPPAVALACLAMLATLCSSVRHNDIL